MYFYPRSPCGERLNGLRHKCASFYFYPRSPCGERRTKKLRIPVPAYFYPRSPCGERHLRVLDGSKSSIISIHALLAESDPGKVRVVEPGFVFLSTLSLRRATWEGMRSLSEVDFYPRSPCGERPVPGGGHISKPDFYPRSPCGERPGKSQSSGAGICISIHALLAESDYMGVTVLGIQHNFYPRSPCGERPRLYLTSFKGNKFLSTLSLRRATFKGNKKHLLS